MRTPDLLSSVLEDEDTRTRIPSLAAPPPPPLVDNTGSNGCNANSRDLCNVVMNQFVTRWVSLMFIVAGTCK